MTSNPTNKHTVQCLTLVLYHIFFPGGYEGLSPQQAVWAKLSDPCTVLSHLQSGMTANNDNVQMVGGLTPVLYPYVIVEYKAEPDFVTGDYALKVGQPDPMG